MANLCKRKSSPLGTISMKLGAPLLCTLLLFAFNATVTTASMRRRSSYLHGTYTAPIYDGEADEFNNIPSAGLEEERAEEEGLANVAKHSGQNDLMGGQIFLDVTPRVPLKTNSSDRHNLDEGDSSYEDDASSSDDDEGDEEEHGNESDEEMDEEDNMENSYNSDDEDDSDDDSESSEMHNASFLEYADEYYEPGHTPVKGETDAKQVIKDNIQEAGRNLKRISMKGIRKAVIGARKGGRALQDGVQRGAKAITQGALATKEQAKKSAKAAIDRVRNRAHKTRDSLKKGFRYMKKLPERAGRNIVRGATPAWSRARQALKHIRPA